MTKPSDVSWFRRQTLRWFRQHGRAFAWRGSTDPYQVLIAEILLQRTRADLVPDAYARFIRAFPDSFSLAAARIEDTVEILHPLGFTHRSARLPALGRTIVERHEGAIPNTKAELLALPGVGEYVANAVLSIAFKKRLPLVDPNVIRLFGRYLGERSEKARPRDDPALWKLVADYLPARNVREFNLAVVDLGAIVCRPRRPRCTECPLRTRCVALRRGDVYPAAARGEADEDR
jgi:A/G-specific adenine glycosylase